MPDACKPLGILLLASCALAQSAAKPPAADRNAFTFTNYNLQVTVQPTQYSLSCRGSVMLRNDSKTPQTRAALQLSSSLQWASVRTQGRLLRFATSRLESDVDHTGAVNEAVVDLSEPVPPGATVQLEVGYSGTVKIGTARLDRVGTPAQVARATDWDRISPEFTGVRGVGNVVWYPVAIEPALLGEGRVVLARLEAFKGRHTEASARIEITVPDLAGQVLLGNGKAVKGSSSITLDFDRLGLDAPFFLMASYAPVEVGNARVWHFPASMAAAQRYASALNKLQPFVSNTSAQPAELVELPGGAANYESGPTLLLPLSEAGDGQLAQLLIHTVTHAAFFSRRPWIYEGLAHYAQALMVEEQFGKAGALQFLEQRRAALAIADTGREQGSGLIQADEEIFYRTKAMFVWWMLRDMVGEQTLRNGLNKYRADQDKEPAYVQRLLEAESKRKLETFFDDWVYRDRGLPDFHIISVYARQHVRGGYLVTVTVENRGGAGAEVPVRANAKGTSGTERLYVAARSRASIRIDLPLPPTEAVVNDGSVPETDISNNTYTVVEAPQ